jgi:hypothetical protein
MQTLEAVLEFFANRDDPITYFEQINDKVLIDLPGTCWMLVVADPHAPFDNSGLFLKAIKAAHSQPHKGRGHCILAGDISDLGSDSKFVHFQHVGRKQTFDRVREFVSRLTHVFHTVYALTANHDDRTAKRLARLLQSDHELVELLCDEGYGRVFDWPYIGIQHCQRIPCSFAKFGSVVISHFAKRSSVIPGRTAQMALAHVRGLEVEGILPEPKTDIVIQGHIHRTADIDYDGCRCIEVGPLCKRMDYSIFESSGHSAYQRWQPSCVVIQWIGGKVDDCKLMRL